jgi:hypothetical protein
VIPAKQFNSSSVSEEKPSPVTGRRLLLSGRAALTREERDGLRRLVDERTRERLGFGVRDGERLRELICEHLAQRPHTHADLAADLRVSSSQVRGALRVLQLGGQIEVQSFSSRGGSIWRLA